MLWCCWLGGRKGIRPVKETEWLGGGMVICLERGAELHIAQLMPLPLTLFASVKSRLVLPLWYRLTRVVTDKGPLNGCVCVCVYLGYNMAAKTSWHRYGTKLCHRRRMYNVGHWPGLWHRKRQWCHEHRGSSWTWWSWIAPGPLYPTTVHHQPQTHYTAAPVLHCSAEIQHLNMQVNYYW